MDFYLKHIYEDLPENYVQEIEKLYQAKTTKDIINKIPEIDQMMTKLKIT